MDRRNFVKNSIGAGIILGNPPLVSGALASWEVTNTPYSQPFRQVHLDFHTSGKIKNIATRFNAEEFANVLDRARVNSVNCFAKCHHGWLYYKSKKFPELVHPHLSKDLLNEQVEALRKKKIKVTAYISLQFDYESVKKHPEWRVVMPDGKIQGEEIGSPTFYQLLCLNTPYREFVKSQIKDVIENTNVDGFWLDIIAPRDCSCRLCLENMVQNGLDSKNLRHRMENAERVIIHFMQEISDFIRSYNNRYLIYFNSGHVAPFHRKVYDAFSHFELESLSSTVKWGFPFFQNEARYVRTLGKEIVGMTGKFHSSWGDFHSYRNKYALEFDCFQSLALNGKCSIGDQLHPDGKIDEFTYDLIGSVYRQVEEKEPWCTGATQIVEIGVFSEEEFVQGISRIHPEGLWGANHILLEAGYQYDVIDSLSDFSKYKLLILPDTIPVSGNLNNKLTEYLNNGGKVIMSFKSGINPDNNNFVPFTGVKTPKIISDRKNNFHSEGEVFTENNYAQYIDANTEIGNGLYPTCYVMYIKGMDIDILPGTSVLANNYLSYFDREGEFFCSHLQTPMSGQLGLPAITQNKNVIYFSHPVFKQYNQNAAPWCKTLVVNAIKKLMPQRLLEVEGPSTLITSLNYQEKHNRQVLHLIHYIPQQKALQFKTIDDIIPLKNLRIKLQQSKKVKTVKIVPQNKDLSFIQKDSCLEILLPDLIGHQMIEIV